MTLAASQIDELIRMRRVADMLITCHAVLRDRYARSALFLNLSVLLVSLWLVAMAFVGSENAAMLSPFSIEPQIFLGCLALTAFVLSLLELKVDWRERSTRHGEAGKVYFRIKSRVSTALSDLNAQTDDHYKLLVQEYAQAGEHMLPIPDQLFNALKKKHLVKVEISKELSRNPGRSILGIRAQLWWNGKI